MPVSLLLSLIPIAHLTLPSPLGREAQAWFLGQIARHRPELAQALHDVPGPKPYTVSGVTGDTWRVAGVGQRLKPGERCWPRVTTLNDDLSGLVVEKILPNLPVRLTLRGMDFRIEGHTLNPADHPWAGQTTYGALVQAGEGGDRSRQIKLEFASPTAFRSEGADIPLPIPSHVFRGYWQKWNAFAPEPLRIQDTWPQFAAACVMVSELTNVNTERWIFANGARGAATGFTGRVGFTLLPRDQCGEWAAIWSGAAQVLRTLAEFAFYSGTGHHTTVGLGQTRPLTPGPSPVEKARQERGESVRS